MKLSSFEMELELLDPEILEVVGLTQRPWAHPVWQCIVLTFHFHFSMNCQPLALMLHLR